VAADGKPEAFRKESGEAAFKFNAAFTASYQEDAEERGAEKTIS
jgi:hypothetical protein